MDGYQGALKLLPPEIVGVFRAYHGQAEELRLRRGQAPHVYDGCRELALDHVPLTELDLRRVLERATGASLHTAATALRRGYICSRGLRIGVCGSAIIRGGEMEGFREFSSIAIRIPRECRGICAAVWLHNPGRAGQRQNYGASRYDTAFFGARIPRRRRG